MLHVQRKQYFPHTACSKLCRLKLLTLLGPPPDSTLSTLIGHLAVSVVIDQLLTAHDGNVGLLHCHDQKH